MTFLLPNQQCQSTEGNWHRAVARILFQPRQRGKRASGADPPAGSRGRAPGQAVRGQSPPEAESFSVVGCPNEMENVLQFYYFTTFTIYYSAKMS